MPILDDFIVSENVEKNYSLEWSKLIYSGINSNDWIIESGDWYFNNDLFSQSSSYYSSDFFGSMFLDSSFTAAKIVASFDMKYEYEWDNDYIQLSISSDNADISNIKTLTGHNYKSFQKEMVAYSNSQELNDLLVSISMNTDESLYYRGSVIKDLKIVSDSGNQVCNFGDSNFDGLININDIMIILNFILQNDIAEGYYKCVSDLNQDGGINILDISIMINFILGD